MTWDGSLCWDTAPVNTVAQQRCPQFVLEMSKTGVVTRFCGNNAVWFSPFESNSTAGWSNYTDCFKADPVLASVTHHIDRIKTMKNIGYGISLVSLSVAVLIMLISRRLHCKSNSLHINLFTAFILRASLSFTKELLFVNGLGLEKDISRNQDGEVHFIHDGMHWECKLLVSLFMYAFSASLMWIFMEGLYLHMLVYKTLFTERSGIRMYVIIGWVSPFLYVIPWILVRLYIDNSFLLITTDAVQANNVDPDERALKGALSSGSALFAIGTTVKKALKKKLQTSKVYHMGALGIAEEHKMDEHLAPKGELHQVVSLTSERLKVMTVWRCWNTDDFGLIWIIKAPVLITIVINFIFFINIVRVLCDRMKTHRNSSGSQQLRKLAKFSLVLIPLFGVLYIVFAAYPHGLNVHADIVYLYCEMFYNSFQGLVLAILFCFLNEEVHNEIRRCWYRHRRTDNGFTRTLTMTMYRKGSNLSHTSASTHIYRDNTAKYNGCRKLRDKNENPLINKKTRAVGKHTTFSPEHCHKNTHLEENEQTSPLME